MLAMPPFVRRLLTPCPIGPIREGGPGPSHLSPILHAARVIATSSGGVHHECF